MGSWPTATAHAEEARDPSPGAGERVVASHRRSYGHGQDVLDPYHYVPALLRKPRAFHQASAMRRYPWPQAFRQALAFPEDTQEDVPPPITA